MQIPSRPHRGALAAAAWLLCLLAAFPLPGAAQRVVSAPSQTITVPKGQTAMVVQPLALMRLSIADPEVAEIFAASPQEILVIGKKLGSTSLMLWDTRGGNRLYTVQVTPDVKGLEENIRTLFPNEKVTVTASGSSVVLSGEVSSPSVGKRIMDVAQGAGSSVVNNMSSPSPPQILLQVRFAEVSRSALSQLGTQISASTFTGSATGGDQTTVQTLSDGLLRLLLLQDNNRLEVVINALRNRGLFRSLAEPNLLALDGEEASFLAGGEFPFPVLQGGQSNAVTIVWKEFGVRLKF
ncbi:MAG: pilus assembly protein N-terminal domain-containing protein, partial [Gemmatimonadetes bacterium]|nr:pilus assembly protein N-terminal domain-containing protein [Gemmatimonadota bacterium]